MATFLSGGNKKVYRSTQTGAFGENAEGGWWAQRRSFDDIEGYGAGESEADALKAADAHIERQRFVAERRRVLGRGNALMDLTIDMEADRRFGPQG